MITNTINVNRYLVSGSSYSITYGYWDREEIKVYLTLSDNTLKELALDTDYTLTAPNGTNGTLTKVSDWGTATKITILREVEIIQERDLVNGQTMDAETIEEALDHAIAAIQQLREEQSRAVKTAVDEEGIDITFPNTESRKGSGSGTVVCFDSSGTTIVLRDLAGFDEDVATTKTNASLAVSSAQAAAVSETNAKNSETNAKSSETSASSSASSASSSANDAAKSKTKAAISEENAESYMQATKAVNEIASEFARGKKVDGSDVVSGETGYKDNAKYYKDLAASSASAAATSETNALASQNAANQSAISASGSASSAKESASAASLSENNASGSASNAAISAADALASETRAKTSETNAKSSESSAATSASNASDSATAASSSKTAAATSEKNAKTSETNAKTSETNASSSKSAAATSASNAKTSETNAQTYMDRAEAAAKRAEDISDLPLVIVNGKLCIRHN